MILLEEWARLSIHATFSYNLTGKRVLNKNDREMNKSKALNRLQTEIRRRNYSFKTEQSYMQWVKRLFRYVEMHGDNTIDEESITDYLNYLAVKRQVAGSTQNQALCAIIFLLEKVLGEDVPELENMKRAKKSKTYR